MTLQNRVTPHGEIVADPARGLFMGNRGGRIHDPATRQLTRRRWASKAWICCLTSFKERQRKVMGMSYTELFFLDEVTALAAGHRPCFECRRRAAVDFAERWAAVEGVGERAAAADMDRVLHDQRLDNLKGACPTRTLSALPDACMIEMDGDTWAVNGGRLLRWTPGGYDRAVDRTGDRKASVLTPLAIIDVLANGYAPVWHPSATSR